MDLPVRNEDNLVSTPLELYQEDLKRDDFSYDADQEKAVKHLQRLYDELVAYTPHKNQDGCNEYQSQ